MKEIQRIVEGKEFGVEFMQQVREKTEFYQISMRDVRDTALAEGHEQGLEQGLAEGAKNYAY